MKVLFFPYLPRNPYQPNLAKALGGKGVSVTGVKDISLRSLLASTRGQEILHLHWTHPYLMAVEIAPAVLKSACFFLILVSQKAFGKKLIWTVHNLGEHEKRHPAFELFCHRLLARLADGIIVHSRHARKKVMDFYRLGGKTDKIRVVPHGHYIDNYPNHITRKEARAKLGIGADRKVFLFLGAIRKYKGLPELISSFSEIATGKELLYLAGFPSGKEVETEISRLAEKREDIIFSPEFVPDEEIQVYMNAADVVVFPFQEILTSGSVFLAMSFAKAVIIPDLEVLEDLRGKEGIITYDPDDENGLKRALASTITMDTDDLGRRNIKEARRHSWQEIAQDTLKLYKVVS